jgi:hypothetical protein
VLLILVGYPGYSMKRWQSGFAPRNYQQNAHGTSITFQWKPSHVGLIGNGRPNELAKTAATKNINLQSFKHYKSAQKKKYKHE